jgi:uncharacterized protein YdhG (YjbR/CyaY superfamily)
MSTTNPVDEYLAALDEPKRATLTSLRDTIMAIVPEAEQCISYGMPAFKLRGKTIGGFAAFKNHLSYLPHSGSVIPELAQETAAYTSTKGSLHFPVDEPLPAVLVRELLEARPPARRKGPRGPPPAAGAARSAGSGSKAQPVAAADLHPHPWTRAADARTGLYGATPPAWTRRRRGRGWLGPVRAGKRYLGRASCSIDQLGQHREPAHPVGERVVQHDHQGEGVLGRTGDQHRRPQRRGPRQRAHDHGQGGLEQRRFVARLAAGHRADVAADIETRRVDPDRAAAARRYGDQPLAQPRHRRDALGNEPAGTAQVESAGLIKHQDDAELLGHLPGVHRQERPVRWARALDDRLTPPHGLAGNGCHGFSQRALRRGGQSPRSPRADIKA